MEDPELQMAGALSSNGGAHVDGEPQSPLEANTPATPVQAPNQAPAGAPPALNPAVAKAVDDVVYSDIGVNTLLVRLKQSIASAKDLALFFKTRSEIEQRQSEKLRELTKKTGENVSRPESRQGSYAYQMREVLRVHDRMAENSLQFSLNLHQMSTDLNQHAEEIDKQRKHWKQVGLNAEKQASDAEAALDKAKGRYNNLAEKYDRARTGDTSGRHFGLRGPKSAEQREEDLHRQVKTADDDYQAKVQNARQLRQELLSTHRPQTVKALQQLIQECDAAVSMQLQKLASQQEFLLLRDGLLIAPPPDSPNPQKSFRDQVALIDNDGDLRNYITSFSGKVPARPAEIKYEQHPTLKPPPQPTSFGPPKEPVAPQQQQQQQQQRPPSQPQQQPQQPPSQFPVHSAPQQAPSLPPQNFQRFEPDFQQRPPQDRFQQQQQSGPPSMQQQRPPYSEQGFGGSPQQYYPPGPMGPISQPGPRYPPNAGQQMSPQGPPGQTQGVLWPPTRERDGGYAQPPQPSNKVFGVTLDDLFARDQIPVPNVVAQCIQAVDHFGLDTEGIYRVPATQAHVNALKAKFDNDPFPVDFTDPESFYHDVHVPCGLLKLFFRELPDPLMTKQRYTDLIDAARIEDDVARRDNLHAIINDLPDPNYATLRALVLHLHRVEMHADQNRMTPSNLAVIFGPTLMGQHIGDMSLAGLQPKVISTILVNALQIFDED